METPASMPLSIATTRFNLRTRDQPPAQFPLCPTNAFLSLPKLCRQARSIWTRIFPVLLCWPRHESLNYALIAWEAGGPCRFRFGPSYKSMRQNYRRTDTMKPKPLKSNTAPWNMSRWDLSQTDTKDWSFQNAPLFRIT